MAHPANLSDDYPLQGDTWLNSDGSVAISVLIVSPAGTIYWFFGEDHNSIKRYMGTLQDFQNALKERNLDKPTTCTLEYVRRFGAMSNV
jgi:hypothetical protein